MATDLTPVTGLDVGDRRTITATFLDAAGDPADVDPNDLTVTTRAPDGTVTEVDPGDISVTDGVVTHEVTFTAGGRWYGRTEWTSASGAQTEEWRAFVRRRTVAEPEP